MAHLFFTRIVHLFTVVSILTIIFLSPKQNRSFRDPLIRYFYDKPKWFSHYGQAVLVAKALSWGILFLFLYLNYFIVVVS